MIVPMLFSNRYMVITGLRYFTQAICLIALLG